MQTSVRFLPCYHVLYFSIRLNMNLEFPCVYYMKIFLTYWSTLLKNKTQLLKHPEDVNKYTFTDEIYISIISKTFDKSTGWIMINHLPVELPQEICCPSSRVCVWAGRPVGVRIVCVWVCVVFMWVCVCVCWPAGGREGCMCMSLSCVCVCALAGGWDGGLCVHECDVCVCNCSVV